MPRAGSSLPDADTIPVGNDLLTLDRSVTALLRSAALLKDASIDSAMLDRLVYARRCLSVDENVALGTGLRMLFERATEHDREKCAIAALRNWHFYGSVWPPSVRKPPTRHGGGGVGSGMAVGRHAAAPAPVDRMRRADRRTGKASSATQRRVDAAEHSSPPAMEQFEVSLREAGAVATFTDGREAAVTGQTPEPPAHARPICAVVQVAADVSVDVCDRRTPVYPVGDESSHTYPSTQVLATVSATEEAAVADLAIETGDPACHPNTVSAQRQHAFVENERVENERVPPHEYDCETSSMLQHLPEIVKKVNSNNQGTLVQGLTMLYDMVSSPDFAGEPDPMNAVIDTGVVTRLVALLKKDNIAAAQSYALQIVALLFRVMDRLGQLLFEHRVFPLISRLIRSPAPSVVSAAVWAVAVLAGVNYSGPSQPMCVMVRAKLKSNGVAERLVDALKAGTLAREDALCVATTISLFFDQRTEEIFDLTLPVFAEFVTSPETSDVLTTLRGLRSLLSDERAIQRVLEANLLKPVVLKLTDRDSYVQCSALHVIFRMSQHGNEEQLQALVDHGVLYTFGVLLSSRDAEIQRVARSTLAVLCNSPGSPHLQTIISLKLIPKVLTAMTDRATWAFVVAATTCAQHNQDQLRALGELGALDCLYSGLAVHAAGPEQTPDPIPAALVAVRRILEALDEPSKISPRNLNWQDLLVPIAARTRSLEVRAMASALLMEHFGY